MDKENMATLCHYFLAFLLLVCATRYIGFDSADAISCYVCDTRSLNMSAKDRALCSKGYGSEFEKKFIKKCKSGDNACKKWQILGKYWSRQCMKRKLKPEDGWMCDGSYDHYWCTCGVDKCNSGGNSKGTPLAQPSRLSSLIILALTAVIIFHPILLDILGLNCHGRRTQISENSCDCI